MPDRRGPRRSSPAIPTAPRKLDWPSACSPTSVRRARPARGRAALLQRRRRRPRRRASASATTPRRTSMPLVCQAASGRRPSITVFGADYPTPDGTCVRDYIHVHDLCSAHLRALEYLESGGGTAAFDLGYGQGTSVQQIIDAVERVSGIALKVEEGERRPGDPARLVADSTRAREVLGWTPARADLDTIVADAWRWERAFLARAVA
ncbi:MAG: GDP-mannose 4,6-dehydratase [Halofilum sp. (in: g-proteobacteria)]|nr:GDP-mannose 4,6-dehydratase [Halofilum sp. (in: g-proteobacteria)]